MPQPLPFTPLQPYYPDMFRVSTSGLAILFSCLVAGNVQAQGPSLSASDSRQLRTVVLFGASWCAPCIAEIRNLPRLAAAAAPDRIVIVWADPEIRRYKLSHYDNVEVAHDDEARRLTALAGSDIAGLPYTAMTDHRGRKCAEWRGPLRPEHIDRLRASCND